MNTRNIIVLLLLSIVAAIDGARAAQTQQPIESYIWGSPTTPAPLTPGMFVPVIQGPQAGSMTRAPITSISGSQTLSGCGLAGVGGDEGAAIQACINQASTAGVPVVINTPSYRDPQGNPAWLVCASPNNDGHGITLPANFTIIGPGWPTRIEIKPGCATPPSEVLYANLQSSTEVSEIRNLVVDGYGLAAAINAGNWARVLLNHVLLRNGAPGSIATFLNGSAANDLSVCCDTRVENVNDTNHTLYWGSRIYAAANAGQNQIVLPSIPAGLVQGGAVVLPEANGHSYTCTATAGSYFLTACNTINGMTVGDRVIIAGGGVASTTLAANAGIGATTITLASVNGIGPGDPIAITGAGSAGGTLNTTVAGFPTAISPQPNGTVLIADPIVTAVSTGAAAVATTDFYTDLQAVEPAGCSGLCAQVALPPTATVTGTVVTPSSGYNFATNYLPNSFAVAYACGISGTTVSLSTSPTDLTCASPYNLPIPAIAGEWITNLPIFAAADAGADSEWSMAKAVSGARAEFVELQNEADPKVSHLHAFGPPPLNSLYGVEFTGGGSCHQCQDDRAQWAGAHLGRKSDLVNAQFDGFQFANAWPTATLQQLGARISTIATCLVTDCGAQFSGFQQVNGNSQYLAGPQVIMQAGIADPQDAVENNNGASYVTEGVICKANWDAAHQPTVTNSTGTSVETYFNGCLIPGGILGPNDGLEISVLFSFNNTANAKTPKVKLDAAPGSLIGTSYMALPSGTGGAVAAGCTILVRNYGATNAQVGMPSTVACPQGGAITTALTTSGIRDTTVPFWVDFSCTTTVNGDTCSEPAFTVKLVK